MDRGLLLLVPTERQQQSTRNVEFEPAAAAGVVATVGDGQQLTASMVLTNDPHTTIAAR